MTRKELLAIVRALQHFHPYLYGQPFTVRTDHAALQWLLKFHNPEGQLPRCIQKLQMYEFVIQYRPGKSHLNVDALSRRPCLEDGCKHCEKPEIQQEKCSMVGEEESTPQPVEFAYVEKGKSHRVCSTRMPDVLEREVWSLKEIREAQMNDPDIAPVLQWLEESSDRPDISNVTCLSANTKLYWAQWDSLVLQDGVMFKQWESPAGDYTILQMVLPLPLRTLVLKQLHNSPTGGHLALTKTLQWIQDRFYWIGCRKDVQLWCQRCDLCSSRKEEQERRKKKEERSMKSW